MFFILSSRLGAFPQVRDLTVSSAAVVCVYHTLSNHRMSNRRFPTIITLVVTVLLLIAAHYHWLPTTATEVLGFTSGGLCVWLTVKEDIWNWPIGIANSAFFLVLFLRAKLFADSSLQVIYIILGFLGWYWWLHGGKNKTELHVTRAGWKTWAVLVILASAATWGATIFLRSIHDVAPFWDALTTVMSLVAQYLLTKKNIDNWPVWISVDVIYIWLYAIKHLYLTSVIYAIFLMMCFVGLRDWRRSMLKDKTEDVKPLVHAKATV